MAGQHQDAGFDFALVITHLQTEQPFKDVFVGAEITLDGEEVILVTTDHVPGKTIKKNLGLVRGNTIRARHLGRDIIAFLRNIVGGEIRDYTKMMAESREQAIDRMVEEAEGLGANAIINVRFTTSMIMQSASEILAYGTAVKLSSPAS